MKGGFRLFAVLTPSLFILDQIVKFWARSVGEGVESRTLLALWPGVFELKLVFNKGVAFGLFPGAGILLAPIAVGIAAVATWYSWKHPSERTMSHVTAALLASGALGNLVDRLVFGKVTDLFWVRAIDFPVFNIADVCITFAGAFLVLGALRGMTHRKQDEPPEDATAAQQEA